MTRTGARMTEETTEIRQERIGAWRQYDPESALSPLLKSALDRFVTLGYHGTTVRMIADGAGMTVPGLYYHYESKQALLVELLKMSSQEIRQRTNAAVTEAGDDPRDRFAAAVQSIVLYMTHRQQLAHLAREIRGLEEPYRSQHIELRDALKASVLTEVISGKALGRFTVDNPHEATRAVLVMCEGVAEWYRPGGINVPEEVADRYVGFALSIVGAVRT